jgi:hypothetical protein
MHFRDIPKAVPECPNSNTLRAPSDAPVSRPRALALVNLLFLNQVIEIFSSGNANASA